MGIEAFKPAAHDFSDINDQSSWAFDKLSEIYGPELAATELSLEHEAYTLGEERFLKGLERQAERGEFSNNTTAKPILESIVPQLSSALSAWCDHQVNKVRRKNPALKYFLEVNHDVAAAVTVRWTLNRIAQRSGAPTVTELACSIGGAIEEEARYGRIRDQERQHYDKHIRKALNQRNGMTYKKAFMAQVEAHMIQAGELNGAWEEWDQADGDIRYHAGIRMLEMLIEVSQLIEVRREHAGNKKLDGEYVYLKEEWADKIASRAYLLGGVNPRYQPMVVQPRPWSGIIGGGYWAKGRKPLSFIRVNGKRALRRYKDVYMPEVYDAVNTAQNSAWAINAKVLAVANEVMGWKHVPIKEFPLAEREELPAKPEGMDDSEDLLKMWKKEASGVYRRDAARISRRMSYEFTLDQANKFAGFEAIYFPYNMDWRGRVYAIPSFNPQGNDMTKGLLLAAQGEPVGLEGIEWLKIHGANTAGIDKVPFNQRKQWVMDNEELILEIARNPLNNTEWMQMDSPFCFLAFCFEWAGVTHDGPAHVSALPIAFDGSCSGIQHFSAMLRDERGGRAVNLLPSEDVQDIYKLVADAVNEQLRKDSQSGTSDGAKIITNEKTGEIIEKRELGSMGLSKAWLDFGVTRGVTKRSVMTLAYGSKAYGFTDQVRDDTVQPAIDNGTGHMFTDAQQASRYMAGLIWDAVSVVVVAAVEAMNWLQKAAKLLAQEVKCKETKQIVKQCLPVSWTTPDGFPVWQEYLVAETKRIDLMFLGDIRIQATVHVRNSDKLDKRKQESGISPNFVHSMDGSHMRRTVAHAAKAYGLKFFAIIHDSFGTIPAQAGKLFKAVRETFVSTYKDHDVLNEFREEFLEQLHESQLEDMPPIPQKGDLDIEQVLLSDFAFA